MIPSGFVTLDAFPVGSSGKLDREALPEPAPRMPPAKSDEPRGEWERRTAKVWAEVLGVGAVGRHDDFFDLGGHSILVAKLQQRVTVEFGRTLSLAALFQAQTVARMAKLLREQNSGAGTGAQPSRLVQVQPAGSLQPLYWIEPSPSFRRVADALGREQPVLGLSLDAADMEALGEEPSLEAMSACLVRTLLAADPDGPYRLGGICNKGVMAFEVASQLVAAGHAVEALFVVDGVNPETFRPNESVTTGFKELRFHVAAAWRLHGRDRVHYALAKARHLVHRIVPLPSLRVWEMPIDPILSRAVRRYAPKPYAGDLTLLPSDTTRTTSRPAGPAS